MRLNRLAAGLGVSLLLLAPSAALAENSAEISNTGPDSTNDVTVNNDQTWTVNNNQDVDVDNTNNQTASSGSATVSHNTTGGDATSGDAKNSNETSTVISFAGNGDACGCPDGGAGGGNLPGGGGSTSGGAGGGSLAAAITKGRVGGGALPGTGASSLIDVSALRQALAGGSSENLAAVNRAKGLSAGLLAAAALLSLLGAAGSAVYAAKKEQSL